MMMMMMITTTTTTTTMMIMMITEFCMVAACVEASCPPLSPSPEVRLRQILSTRTKVEPEFQAVMTSFGNKIPRHKYLFVTAVSSNHYEEMQGLVHNLIQFVFPKMAGNYTFVMSLLPRAEFLIWMDASVRWNNAASFDRIFQRAEQQGVQCALGGGSIAVRTAVSTFRFYGDQTCQYTSFPEIEANCEVYHNDVFVREAIVEPWLSCAFSRTCMCVKNFEFV
nr:hypothetical protein BaRGS_005734 [Batillaria attramentaria]